MKTKKSPIRTAGESAHWRRFRLDCSVLSAAGVGRNRNEDHVLFAAPGAPQAERAEAGYVFAVADGEVLGEVLDDPRCTTLRPDLMLHRLHDANDRCHQLIGARCAVTALWMWEDPDSPALVAGWSHVGNTRLYHHARGQWKRLTRDHAKGRLLDRAVGQGPGLEIDTATKQIYPGDRLALVTPGVWRTAPPAGAVPAGSSPPTAEAVRQLVGQARLNGSREDTTAIVIAVKRIDEDPEPEH